MAKTLEQLLSLSSIIANETKAGANTALRVGGLFSDIIYYLRDLDYADKDDIPSLEGYATEQWVLGKGYATTSDLDNRIDALVNGAPAAYDTLKEIADVLAGNVNSISDILTALGNKADKATTLSGYGITDAYTITQIDSIVNRLSGNISTLEGYFTDGVANSALKLSDNGSYTAWGQTFFTNGKPKSLNGSIIGGNFLIEDRANNPYIRLNQGAKYIGYLQILEDGGIAVGSTSTKSLIVSQDGDVYIHKLHIGNGTIEWDETNKGFKIVGGLYTESYLSAKGANTNGGSTPSGNQYTRLDTWDGYTSAMDGWVLSAKLGKGLYDTQNSLITRVGALEDKATNVSFTQSLTSGTQIGSISIDGVAKNIYAPTIPTKLSQFTDDVVSGKYLHLSGGTLYNGVDNTPLTIKGTTTDAYVCFTLNNDTYLGAIGINKTLGLVLWDVANQQNRIIYHRGNTSTIKSDLGLGTFAYKSSLAFADLTNKPTTLGGYGITDWSVKYGDYDVNGRYDAGYYVITNGSNAPTHASYGSLLVMPYRKASGNTIPDYATQIFLPNGDDSGYPNDMFFRTSLGSSWNAWQRVLTDNNYTSYTYSQSTIDTKLSGYLPLSGGTMQGDIVLPKGNYLRVDNAYEAYAMIGHDNSGILVGTPILPLLLRSDGNSTINGNTIIHSGNIGSQSVASAAKLTTARTIWGQSFDGTGNVSGHAMGLGGAIDFQFTDEINRYGGNLYLQHRGDGSQSGTGGSATGNVVMCKNGGNVLIGTTTDNGYKLDVSGNAYFNSYVAIANNNGLYFKDNSGTIRSQVYIDQYNNTSIGYGAAQTGGNTSIYGTDIVFHSSADRAERVRILSNGHVGIGTTNPQYKLDVNGTLHASGMVIFDSELNVASSCRLMGNVGIGVNADDNKLCVYGVVRSAAYNAIGNNNAAFVFDKPGSNYTGIGANGVADTIYFGACSITGAWVTDYYQKWHFNGTIYGKVGIWSDGYVSAKGQNTSSDMRLKNVLNEVVLNVSDIANAPSIRFAWKNGGGIDVGSSAQYWQGVLPDAVKGRDGMLEMQYANIALLSAISLAKNFETMDERVARLERENKELRNEIMILKGGHYA